MTILFYPITFINLIIPGKTGDFFNFLKKFDHEDVQQISERCYGFPCPLMLKVYSSGFRNPRFNGYYIATFVGRTHVLELSNRDDR